MDERSRGITAPTVSGDAAPLLPSTAPELELLRLLERHPDYSQRQISSALGVSLGKAHYLLKALLDKGWVKAQNFKRSEHKARYLYVLTPSGVRQRLQLTHAFLARKEREFDVLQAQIAALRAELAAQSAADHGR
jgi:MarR family transcriptional regulator, temperature-dependent positive regulator of motility